MNEFWNPLTRQNVKPRFVGYEVSGSAWTATGPSVIEEDLDEAVKKLREWIDAGYPAVSVSRKYEWGPRVADTDVAETAA